MKFSKSSRKRALIGLVPLLIAALVYAFNARRPARFIRLERALTHRSGVETFAFSPDGKTLACGESNGELYAWDLKAGTGRKLWKDAGLDGIDALVYSEDGHRLAIGTAGHIRVWNVASRRVLWSRSQSDTDTVDSLAFSPDGTQLVSTHWRNIGEGGEGKLRVWSAANGRMIHKMWGGSESEIFGDIVWTKDSHSLIISRGGKVEIYDARTWHLQKQLRIAGGLADMNFALSRDGRFLAQIYYDETAYNDNIAIWDLRHPQKPRLFKESLGAATQMAFSTDGQFLFVASSYGSMPANPKCISIYEMKSGKLARSLTGMRLVATSPDGSTVATGTDEPDSRNIGVQPGKVVRLWRLH